MLAARTEASGWKGRRRRTDVLDAAHVVEGELGQLHGELLVVHVYLSTFPKDDSSETPS